VARFLVSALPALAHMNPMLAVVSELADRGHAVVWCSIPQFRSRIEQVGAAFSPMRRPPDLVALAAPAPSADAEVRQMFVDGSKDMVADFAELESGFDPDAVLVDMCSLGARLHHERGGPPWATLGLVPLWYPNPGGPAPSEPVLSRDQFPEALTAYHAQRRALGLRPGPDRFHLGELTVSPYLHVQCCPESFEYPRPDRPSTLHYVGFVIPPQVAPFRPPAWWRELESGLPVVHVTQGSVATNPAHLIQPALEGLASDQVLLVATALAGTQPPARRTATIHVERYIPYMELLPHVDVMVSNSGYGGVGMALANGVPLVVGGPTRGHGVGERVSWAGVGVDIGGGIPAPEVVAGAVRRVLADPAYRENAGRLQRDNRFHDAPVEAADLLEELAETRAAVTRRPAGARREARPGG
jgi:UDP:flavonoid glycosyltransferase YjiC (YdhE family)